MHFFAEPEFWVLVAAVILVALLWRPGKRFLIGGLDARAERIGDELATAHRLRDEAEAMLAQYREQERRAAAGVLAKKSSTWSRAVRAGLERINPPVTVSRLAPLSDSISRQISCERMARGE